MTRKTTPVLIWPVLFLMIGAIQVQAKETMQKTSIPKPAAKDLIVNGNFSKGSTGFQTDYSQGTDTQASGSCAVVGSPHDSHPGGADFGDHTTGKGQMLALNGSETAGTGVWRETVRVRSHQRYRFTGWAASWGMGDGSKDTSPARLQITINGTPIAPALTVPADDGKWAQFKGMWQAPKDGTVTIQVTDLNTDGFCNDFAIDDLAFSPITPVASRPSVLHTAMNPDQEEQELRRYRALYHRYRALYRKYNRLYLKSRHPQ